MKGFYTFWVILLTLSSWLNFADAQDKEIPPVYEPIHPYLATPAPGHIYEIPVVIMRFLPTSDGEHFLIDLIWNIMSTTLGVKEIWIWQGGVAPSFPAYEPDLHKPENFRSWWESNMSSPLTGDISNSNRDNTDLPVYNSTYTVYGQNFRRSQAEAVHNHGHQLEAILSHVNHLEYGNTDLFWKKLVGQDENGNFITGHTGWTHMPPNTTKHYDYTQNRTLVESDIENWTPDNSGSKKLFNVDTYGNLTYQWPDTDAAEMLQRVESQWYIYWMQNMPGHENQIQYGNKDMTNWWVFTADWDTAISSSVRLTSH